MFALLISLLLVPQLVDRTEEAIQQAPPSEVSLQKRADIYMARKMYRAAIDTYEQAIDAEPENRRLYNKLGIACHNLGLLEQAKKNYQKAAGVEREQGGFGEAVGGFFKKLFGGGDPVPPKPPVVDDRLYAQAINNLGTVYYAERQYGKAAKFYRKALNFTPDSASVHSNLGTAYFAQEKFEKASEQFLIALQLDPLVFEHRNPVGTILQERSVENPPRFYYHMAKAYAQNGMYERSLLYLRRAIEEGYSKRRQILAEAAFEPLHENTEFQTLLGIGDQAN